MSTIRIISYNVNGIRAAINKGFMDWLATQPADIICLQEIKAEKENIDVAALHAACASQVPLARSGKAGLFALKSCSKKVVCLARSPA